MKRQGWMEQYQALDPSLAWCDLWIYSFWILPFCDKFERKLVPSLFVKERAIKSSLVLLSLYPRLPSNNNSPLVGGCLAWALDSNSHRQLHEGIGMFRKVGEGEQTRYFDQILDKNFWYEICFKFYLLQGKSCTVLSFFVTNWWEIVEEKPGKKLLFCQKSDLLAHAKGGQEGLKLDIIYLKIRIHNIPKTQNCTVFCKVKPFLKLYLQY